MITNTAYTTTFRNYGKITVPKGTKVTHTTAMGIDKNMHFVDSFGWVRMNYPTIANPLIHDLQYYGLDVPKELIDYQN